MTEVVTSAAGNICESLTVAHIIFRNFSTFSSVNNETHGSVI